jgi:hypothetical protein
MISTDLPSDYGSPDRRKKVLFGCAFAFFAIFVHVIRRTDQIVNPQLWAEDGVIFLQDQLSIGINSLFTPYAGYIHLLPRLTAFVADKVVTLDYVPTAYVFGALLIASIGSFFVTFSRLPWPAGPLFAIAAVMVPHGGEVFLNITNVQWMIAPILMVIAIQDEPQGYFSAVIDLLAVVIVGLTGPFIVFAAPFVVGRLMWRTRCRYNFALASVAILAATIQFSFILGSSQPPASEVLTFRMLVAAFLNFWYGLWFNFLTQYTVALMWFFMVLTAGLTVTLWALLPSRTKLITSMLIIFGLLIFNSALFKLGSVSGTIQPLGSGQRYFFIPYVLFSWVLILGILQAHEPAKSIAAALILLLVGSTAPQFQAPPLPDMEWRRHVFDIGSDPRQVPINPSGWSVTVHR